MHRRSVISLLLMLLVVNACGSSEPAAEDAQQADTAAAEDVVQLPPDASADISVQSLTRRRYPKTVEAPGEVKLNAYRSAQVAPRIAAQVVARQARLGEVVKQGQPLVSLSSIEVAAAQGALVTAAHEWSRLRSLGKNIVGEKRYVAAKVAYQNARAALAAFGFDADQIDHVQGETDPAVRGRLQLVAPLAGTVLADDFVVGQYVNAGQQLFLIADMRSLWVEAEVRPDTARAVAAASQVRVVSDGVAQTGTVVQVQPSVQTSTRTVGIRAELPRDPDHPLYPGDFVTIELPIGMSAPVLAVPEGGLVTLADDTWAVFVRVGPHKFRRQKVQLGARLGAVTVIKGVAPGSEVVTAGAFYLNSELAKAGFGDDD